MKKTFKKNIKQLAWRCVKLIYPDFNNYSYSPFVILKYAFMQKIIGINRSTHWPVHYSSRIKCPEKIQWGTKGPGLAIDCYLDGRNGIIIEENVWIGPKVSIVSQNHDSYDYNKYVKADPIIIRKNSLLTTNCTILAGVELGEHTIVAAGAVVTKSFPEGNQVLAGIPAKVIKKLTDYEGVVN